MSSLQNAWRFHVPPANKLALSTAAVSPPAARLHTGKDFCCSVLGEEHLTLLGDRCLEVATWRVGYLSAVALRLPLIHP